jgi:hypothetical protein
LAGKKADFRPVKLGEFDKYQCPVARGDGVNVADSANGSLPLRVVRNAEQKR